MVVQPVQMESGINALNGLKITVEGKAVSTFGKAAAAAAEITAILRPSVATFAGGTLPTENLLEDFSKINAAEARFVEAFNTELGAAVSSEFFAFYKSYYSRVPWYGQISYLMVLALAALVACCAIYFLLPAEAPPAPSAPTPSAPKVVERMVR